MDVTEPAPASTRRPARRGCLIALAAVVLAAVVTGFVSMQRPASTPRAAASRTAPASTPTTSTTTSPTPRPLKPVAVVRRTTPIREFVPPSAPVAFTLTGPKFTVRAHVCGMANIRPLTPPGDEHNTVCWVREGFGVAPGSRTATTYVLGHSWAQDPLEVLNPASELATRQILKAKPRKVDGVPIFPVSALDGYRLVLETGTGVLTYIVREAYGVDKLKLASVHSAVDERVHNRVALFTCAELNGVDHPYNVVLYAYLHSSVRT